MPVGLIGKILVTDNEGIATAAANGYRVMKRTGPNQVLILFR
ncbi:hypothetical protein [Bacillus cereus]